MKASVAAVASAEEDAADRHRFSNAPARFASDEVDDHDQHGNRRERRGERQVVATPTFV